MASHVFITSDGVALHCGREGDGMPLLALHGGYSTRDEIEAILGLVLPDSPTFERWTPDLPGMGASIATSVDSAEQVVDALCALVDAEFGGRPFVILGHSLGGRLARAVAARRPAQVAALALLCPLAAEPVAEPAEAIAVEPGAVETLSDRERGEFEAYFVWHTAEMVDRFRTGVAPSLDAYDGEIVGRVMESAGFEISDAGEGIPTLVMLGRRDSFIGFRVQAEEAETWPRATVVIVDDAGHALPHEKPELVTALLADLLARAVPGGDG